MQLNIPYVRYAEEPAYAARLSTTVVLLEDVSGLFDQLEICTVSVRPHDALNFRQKFGLCGRDCDFNRRMRTARWTAFVGWHIAEMFVVLPSGRGLLYA